MKQNTDVEQAKVGLLVLLNEADRHLESEWVNGHRLTGTLARPELPVHASSVPDDVVQCDNAWRSTHETGVAALQALVRDGRVEESALPSALGHVYRITDAGKTHLAELLPSLGFKTVTRKSAGSRKKFEGSRQDPSYAVRVDVAPPSQNMLERLSWKPVEDSETAVLIQCRSKEHMELVREWLGEARIAITSTDKTNYTIRVNKDAWFQCVGHPEAREL